MKTFAYTLIGPRKTNEDYFAINSELENSIFCIADGVGGNQCGEFAAKFSVESFINKIKEYGQIQPNLRRLLEDIHQDLLVESSNRAECRGMATTFTGVTLKANLLQFVHTGDSRLYLLRGNGLRQLTTDHTEVKRLVGEGLLTQEEAKTYTRRNILDSALGTTKYLQIMYASVNCESKDRLILSTDGFYNVFSKAELRDISLKHPDFDDYCKGLVSELHLKTLQDNTSFIAIEV